MATGVFITHNTRRAYVKYKAIKGKWNLFFIFFFVCGMRGVKTSIKSSLVSSYHCPVVDTRDIGAGSVYSLEF